MKKLRILTVSLSLILVLMLVIAAGACGGGEETSSPEGEETETTPPEQEEVLVVVLPAAGEWTATTEFGKLVITVSQDSTSISEISLNFSGEYMCQGMGIKGEVSISSLWPIIDGQFTADVDLSKSTFVQGQVTIKGSFDKTGQYVSGTWDMWGECIGTWESP